MNGILPMRFAIAVAALLATGGCMSSGIEDGSERRAVPAGERFAIAVLGDSDSHAYSDDINLPPPHRGGHRFGPVTLQWTEVLDRLRGDRVDFGGWGTWGTRRRYAVLRRLLGRTARYPLKQDFEYNTALSGATCDDLTTGEHRQVPVLTQLIARRPARWDRGLVVIRIGVNSIATEARLEGYAVSGLTADVEERIAACVGHIEAAIEAIREVHSTVPIALVGIAEDINGPPLSERWHTRVAVDNIRRVLDRFDDLLEDRASEDPAIVFVDDRAWWEQAWGGRDETGAPRFRAVRLGGPTAIENTRGDHPSNAITGDGHAGTVANGLWARHLVRRVNVAFGLGLSPPLDAEIADLVDPEGKLGIAPPREATRAPLVTLPQTRLQVRLGNLPLTLPAFTARASDGQDILATAVAFSEDETGRRSWLYGDGDGLQLRADRHGIGEHDVHIIVRDRNGQSATARLAISIAR